MFGDDLYDPACAYASEPLAAQLEALAAAVDAGKARHVALSNETPWGLMRFLALAEASGGRLPRVAALQNAYSLTCRTFDAGGLAEACHLEGVSLLAYSPLAMGLLTGACVPRGSRIVRGGVRHAPAGPPPRCPHSHR